MSPPPDVSERAREVAAGLPGTHRRLVCQLGDRWVKGTGFCHSSVGRDLEAIGVVESRVHHREGRQIRLMPLGREARRILEETP